MRRRLLEVGLKSDYSVFMYLFMIKIHKEITKSKFKLLIIFTQLCHHMAHE